MASDTVLSKSDVEGNITQTLSGILNSSGKLVKQTLSDKNSVYVMTTSGSKGNPINISQITALVGQQSVLGSRIHGASAGS